MTLPPSFTYLTHTWPAPIIHSLDKYVPSTTDATFYRVNRFDSRKAYQGHQMHCPRGPIVILRPHTLSFEWSEVSASRRPSLLAATAIYYLLFPTISLLFLLLPIMHWPPFKPQIGGLHIIALTIPLVWSQNWVHLNEVQNCSAQCFYSPAVLRFSPAIHFDPSSLDKGSRCHFSGLRQGEGALCFSGLPFITVILLICNVQNGDQFRLTQRHCWRETSHGSRGKPWEAALFSYPKIRWT